MNLENRRTHIYNMLKKRKEISVTELAEFFGVSSMTIRRDLTDLQRSNLIKRTYGKAYINSDRQEFSYSLRSQTNILYKRKIAQTALNYINPDSVIFTDSSSTVTELMRILPENYYCSILTNSFEILKILSNKPKIRTYIIGGFLTKSSAIFEDDRLLDIVKHTYADLYIASCGCFSFNGLFNDGATSMQLMRTMKDNSAQSIILADHTKANSSSLFLLYSWDVIDYLITDEPLDDKLSDAIQAQGTQIIW